MTAIMDRWRNVVSWGKDGSDAGQSQYLGMFKDVSGEMGEDLRQKGSCCFSVVKTLQFKITVYRIGKRPESHMIQPVDSDNQFKVYILH